MAISENEFFLEDRLQKIRSTIEQYGDNCCINFSGGKDSTVLHYLFDVALPDNKIPRVYCNTGIEYKMIVDFVKKLQETDDRIKIIQPKVPIKKVLEEHGYPFKSKMHAVYVSTYRNNNKRTISVEKYYSGVNKGAFRCPNILKYQFEDVNATDFPISDKCCTYLKEKPLDGWQKENNTEYRITGIMRSEGGRRQSALCTVFDGKGKLKSFQPLALATKEWEDWFIDKYNIRLADLYYPPYNFNRTGCKGCPFAVEIQQELDIMAELLPNERKQCEAIWKPVYAEYRWLGYRLKKYY